MRIQPLFLCTLLATPATAQVTEIASTGPSGVLGDDGCLALAMTPDARFVAFASRATNLVSGDTNGVGDIFLRDRHSGAIERISVGAGAVQADLESLLPALSADGRFVAFWSGATNLVAGDTNGFWDIFVRDRLLGTTVRVNVSSAGVQASAPSAWPSISADGRYVAFASSAGNLVSGDTNGVNDVFVHDLATGTTQRVSVNSGGSEADASSNAPSISADGSCVAFDSIATNLVGGDTNGCQDVFVRMLASGTTERVSVAGLGIQATDVSRVPSISADGRYVAFESYWNNFVPGDTTPWIDIYVRDRLALTTTRASVSSTGAEADMHCRLPRIASDGRSVAFYSMSALLVPQDTNNATDVFLHDLADSLTERVSVAHDGAQGNSHSYDCALSADGRFAIFLSGASNLVPGDTNGAGDGFLRDRRASGATSQCHPGSGGVVACPCANPPGGSGGCDNSSTTGGARLDASGMAYLAQDALVFSTSGEKPTATSIVLQGDAFAPAGLVFGQGVRCVAGALKRMYVKTASGGEIEAPDLSSGDASVSARSAQLGDPIQPGGSRWYFVYYRDPIVLGGCSTASTFNATQSVRIDWQP